MRNKTTLPKSAKPSIAKKLVGFVLSLRKGTMTRSFTHVVFLGCIVCFSCKNNCSAVRFLISLNELDFIYIHFAHLQLKIYSVIIWLLVYSVSSPISEDVIELDNIWFLITFYRTSSIPFIFSFELSSWCFCAPGHVTWSLTAQLSPVGPPTTGLILAASCQKGGSNQADDSLNGWFGVFLSMWPLCLFFFLTYWHGFRWIHATIYICTLCKWLETVIQ